MWVTHVVMPTTKTMTCISSLTAWSLNYPSSEKACSTLCSRVAIVVRKGSSSICWIHKRGRFRCSVLSIKWKLIRRRQSAKKTRMITLVKHRNSFWMSIISSKSSWDWSKLKMQRKSKGTWIRTLISTSNKQDKMSKKVKSATGKKGQSHRKWLKDRTYRQAARGFKGKVWVLKSKDFSRGKVNQPYLLQLEISTYSRSEILKQHITSPSRGSKAKKCFQHLSKGWTILVCEDIQPWWPSSPV